MKKRLLVLMLIICVIVLGIFVSCNNNVPCNVDEDINFSIGNDNLKRELTIYHITDDYKISADDMMDNLNNFLISKENLKVSASKSINLGYDFNILSNVQMNLTSCKSQTKNQIEENDNCLEDIVNFNIIDIRNSEGSSSYAIMTDDKR